MEIADSFRVSTPIRDTWNVLLDIEGIAPCMPGAQLQEVEGNEYRGVVKVKVGPITAQYKGTATLVDVDEAAHRILIDAAGRDTRGQGNANASIVVSMTEDGDGTIVEVVTDLAITGKVAQFGRGVLDDVSAKLLRQFVDNLERDVLSNSDATIENPPRVSDPEPSPFSSEESPASNGTTASGPRRIDSPEAEPIDLLDMAGGSAAGRLVPIAVAALVVFVAWRLLRKR